MSNDKNNAAPNQKPAELAFDVEAMLAACVPGGSIVDPQVVADNIRAWAAERKPAELAEQQGQVIVHALADAYAAGAEGLQFGGLARMEALAAALAATGKQQVGEVQGDAVEHAKNLDLLLAGYHVDAEPRVAALNAAIAALAARQPGAQEELHGFLKNSTPLREAALRALGFIDRSDEHGRTAYDCLRRELHAECAAPPAQGIDMGELRELLNSAALFYDKGFEGRCRSKIDAALALIDQRDAAPGVGQ